MEKTGDTIFFEEEKYLDRVNEGIKKEIEKCENDLIEIPKKHTNVLQGDSFLVESLMSMVFDRLGHLMRNENSPYFGRIDFKEDLGNRDSIYIGKSYFYDKNNKKVVNDWRSPVCSIYYDSEIGPVSYMAPSGIVSGDLSLKRQFIIKDKKLLEYLDSSLVTSDEVLKRYLDTHADNKMKDIIASIQKEQNAIIRKPLECNLFVQGIAGSGKTSVALHRIAYLIYLVNEINKKNRKTVNSNKFTIIGPNSYFLDYISEVLPDMDVENANQETMFSLTKEIIGDNIKLDSSKMIDSSIKSSLEYLKAISSFISDYINSRLDRSFVVGDAVVFSNDFIKSRFNSNEFIYDSANNFISLYSKRIREDYESFGDIINKKLRMKMKYFPVGSEERNLVIKEINNNNSKIKTGLRSELKSFFKDLLGSPLDYYKEFIRNIDKYLGIDNVDEFKRDNLKGLNKKMVSKDDLASLIYIKSLVSGIKEYRDTIHVAIDEAQDLSLSEFFVLRRIFPTATFSVFGDLNQKIYSYRGVSDWNVVGKEIFNSNYELVYLNQSYRTTDEIIREANKISRVLTGSESVNNVRHGDSVNYINSSKKMMISDILKSIDNMLDSGCKTIALITKTEKEAKDLNSKLEKMGVKVKNITGSDDSFYVGICTIASYMSKGLEFDGTILCDVNDINYDISNDVDMALLYVEMTRPLHKLDIIYDGRLPEVLNDKNNVKIKKLHS